MEEQAIYHRAIQGEANPVEAYAELLAQQEALNEKIENLKPLVLEELNKYPEKEVSLYGLTWQKRNAPGRWNYKGVSQWQDLSTKLKSIEAMAQQVYKSGSQIFDEQGVEITAPEYTHGKETFAVLKI